MKRFNTTLTIALLSTCFAGVAVAQDRSSSTSPNPNKTQTAPSRSDVQQQQANPSNENMDANVQRAHSRARGSTASNAKTSQANVGEVRDWRAIDKNHDNLIEPDEMEAYLNSGKAPAKTSSSSNGSTTASSSSTSSTRQ